MSEMLSLQLACSDFPSLPFEGRAAVFLGIQYQQEVLEETPAATAEGLRFTGQGNRGERWNAQFYGSLCIRKDGR